MEVAVVAEVILQMAALAEAESLIAAPVTEEAMLLQQPTQRRIPAAAEAVAQMDVVEYLEQTVPAVSLF
jgi:hypothetical protein